MMSYRILVVEDNEPNRELISDWLEVEGFEVRAVENLTEAFAALNSELPHAILLDVQLGMEDGLTVAQHVRQEPTMRHIPILAVTAHAMVTDQERVIQAGCSVCISKPIDFKLLSKELQRWLRIGSTV
ncbi:MAG TPA: response regulator [Acidobacteriaceae bacterium]|jgi:CheY-like chemotaxis protein